MSKTEIQVGIHASLSIGPARTARVKTKGGLTTLVAQMRNRTAMGMGHWGGRFARGVIGPGFSST
jgi:hypothetical protein